MARVYATRAQLVAYAPASVTVPADPEATRLLTRASERVDEALLTAVYDTDTAGLPTDANITEALQLAACAQAVWWLQGAEETGAGGAYRSVGIGSARLDRGTGAATSAGSLAPQAARHLRLAVDTNQQPLLTGFIYSY